MGGMIPPIPPHMGLWFDAFFLQKNFRLNDITWSNNITRYLPTNYIQREMPLRGGLRCRRGSYPAGGVSRFRLRQRSITQIDSKASMPYQKNAGHPTPFISLSKKTYSAGGAPPHSMANNEKFHPSKRSGESETSPLRG